MFLAALLSMPVYDKPYGGNGWDDYDTVKIAGHAALRRQEWDKRQQELAKQRLNDPKGPGIGSAGPHAAERRQNDDPK